MLAFVTGADGTGGPGKLSRKHYKAALNELQVELVKLQDWIRHKKLKVVVLPGSNWLPTRARNTMSMLRSTSRAWSP